MAEEAENNENQENNSKGNCKVILVILIAFLIIGGSIGTGVYFAVSAIISGVGGGPPAQNSTNNGIQEPPKNKSSDFSEIKKSAKNNTGNLLNDSQSTIIPTTGSTTTTNAPPQSLPRDILSCDGNHTISQPWSWSVKIMYRAKIQVPANQTLLVNYNYEYDEIVEEDIEKEIDLMCGGTVIDNFSIITTARCCSDIKSSLTPTPIISLGLDRLLRPAQNMTIHPLWTDGIEDGADRNDVCVIQVEKDLFYSGDEQLSTEKACLPPDEDHIDAGAVCFTGGFGSLMPENLSENFPKNDISEVEVLIMADKYCRRSALSSSGFIWNEHFCADFLRKDPGIACNGDLGGALICILGNKPIIFGVTSQAIKCGLEDNPAVYTKLSEYTRWIKKIIT